MAKIASQADVLVEEVDCLCLGTSIIVSLEAIYQSRKGKRVLMVDRSGTFGGAWKTVEIDGIRDVENAIHYFMPDAKGIKYLEEELKWPIEVSKRKHRYFKIFGGRYVRFKYDSVIGRFFNTAFYSGQTRGFGPTLRHLFKSIYDVTTQPRVSSMYVSSGVAGIIHSMKTLLSGHEIDMRFNTNISKIFFDLKNRTVHCEIADKTVICNSLILGHGARLPPIESTDGSLELTEKFHYRPAFHLIVEDDYESPSLEVIFSQDRLIKYVHDVTRFSSLSKSTNDKRKVLVFGLHSDVSDGKDLPNELFKKLKNIGFLGKSSRVTASRYSDIVLPTLYDEDLYLLKDKFGDLVNILRTESLANGVGYYADKWKS